ncbi:hypothetical protein Scep_027709 [Stephania cephalantha]|uniref:DUF4283 domain-containing protein n=1 Tax=Stephania cephalantha TaxID=152367 RepID=A0AAP0EBU9_9MAGN
MSSENDVVKALLEGPWVIMGHCQSVHIWSPSFRDMETLIPNVSAWIRFPNLPLMYYQEAIIARIGDKIRKTIKVDMKTTIAQKGRYARVAVQLDLSKPMVQSFKLEGSWQKVEYEGLPHICFTCGKVAQSSELSDATEARFDPRMLVQRNQRKPPRRSGENQGTPSATETKNSSRSRFDILNLATDPAASITEANLGTTKGYQLFFKSSNSGGSNTTIPKRNGLSKGKQPTQSIWSPTKKLPDSKPAPSKLGQSSKRTQKITKPSTRSTLSDITNALAQRRIKESNPAIDPPPGNLHIVSIDAFTSRTSNDSSKKRFRMVEPERCTNHPPSTLAQHHQNDEAIQVWKYLYRWLAERMLGSMCPGDLIRCYKPDMLVLSEPRTSGAKAQSIARTLEFGDCFIVEAQGFSGGICVLWNNVNISVEVLKYGDQWVHLTWKKGSERGLLTALYASP